MHGSHKTPVLSVRIWKCEWVSSCKCSFSLHVHSANPGEASEESSAGRGDTTWYISSRGEDSDTCGEMAESACRSLDPIWERIQGLKPFCDPVNNTALRKIIEVAVSALNADLPLYDVHSCTDQPNNVLIWEEIFQNIITLSVQPDSQQCASAVDYMIIQVKKTLSLRMICWLKMWGHDLSEFLAKTLNFAQSLLESVDVTVITDTNVLINSSYYSAPSNITAHMYFISSGLQAMEVSIISSSLTGIYFHTDNTVSNLYVQDSTFCNSGLSVTSNNTFILINNCILHYSFQTLIEVQGESTLSITSSNFTSNSVVVLNLRGTIIEVENSNFLQNIGFDGVVILASVINASFSDCYFESNKAAFTGGL